MTVLEPLKTLDARIPRGSVPAGLAVLGQVFLAFGVWAICFSIATHWYGPSADQFEYGGVALGVLLLAAGALLYRGLVDGRSRTWRD